MLSKELVATFFNLVRLGIGNDPVGYAGVVPDVDWNAIETLAAQHGLSAIIVDGVERLPEGQRPPKPVLLQWIGETLQGYEYRYDQYCKAIGGLASFYNKHGYRMMLLKGYACALDWPKPDHRPCGDIDIWLFGRQAAADAALSSKFKDQRSKFKVDRSHHHHTVFDWGGFTVENHYDFINVHHHKSNAVFERILKELASDDSNSIDVCGAKVYLPSANLHALFLLKHTMMHFAAEGITLRQLLDWAFFVKAHVDEVDWSWLEGVLEQFGMRKLYDIFNTICVDDLGFDANLFGHIQVEPILKDRVLNEIIMPEYSEHLPNNVFKRIIYKYRRWQGNAWKHDLCYKDSMASALWSGIVGHLMKPGSI